MARERWRKVPGWPGYKVSSNGRVRGPRKLLKPTPDKDDYLYVTLRDGQRSRRVGVHVLVLEVFREPRPEGAEALHGPDGRQVNHAAVLRWGTHRENERDKRKNRKLIGKVETASRPETSRAPVTSELPDG